MKYVWYVQGADPTEPIPLLFRTELDAETYARIKFPDEHPDTRHTRVYFREVHDLKGEKQ